MSALEQIRKRPAITIGIIGFALILFLFTGINGCDRLVGGDRDTAAKVDGEKIKYDELRLAADNYAAQYEQQYGRKIEDMNAAYEVALQQIINSRLMDKEIERLGIKVTDKEISSLIYGETALPYFKNMAQNYGFASMDELYQFATSGQQGSEMAQMILDNTIQMLREQLPQQKFESLLGAIQVNNLDAKAYYDANATTSTLYIARQDLSTIPDDQAEVTDDEVRARYNEVKSRYALTEPQTIADYILINVTPDRNDYIAAQQEVEDAIVNLKQQPGLEAIAGNYNFSSTSFKGSRDSFTDNQIKNHFDSIVSKGVFLLQGNEQFVIGKLLSTENASETAKVEVLAFNTLTNNDSIVNLLNQGTAVDQIAELTPANQRDINLINDPNAFLYEHDTLNEYFSTKDEQGMPIIARVVEKSQPVTIYEIAKIERPVEASDATYSSLLEGLTAYIAANPNAADFKANGTESNFDILQTAVAPSQLSMLGLPSSANAARWATEAKKGNVSDVFTDDAHSYLLVLAVNDRYDSFVPVSDPNVANAIREQLRAEKKGAKLVAELNGKGTDVDSYAAAMNVTPETISANYGTEYVRGFVPGDPALLAAVKNAKKGDFVGPLATRNSVIVFSVNDVETSNREYDFETDARTALQRGETANVLRNVPNILRANKKISYNVQRFFQN